MVISIGIMFQNNGIMFNFSRKMLSFFYLYTNFVDGKMKIHRKNGYFYKKNASDKSIMKESENLWKLISLVSIQTLINLYVNYAKRNKTSSNRLFVFF